MISSALRRPSDPFDLNDGRLLTRAPIKDCLSCLDHLAVGDSVKSRITIDRYPRALERFECVMIDEFHSRRGSHPTHIALLESLRPRFLLGLTGAARRRARPILR